jgi:hypothetical protein
LNGSFCCGLLLVRGRTFDPYWQVPWQQGMDTLTGSSPSGTHCKDYLLPFVCKDQNAEKLPPRQDRCFLPTQLTKFDRARIQFSFLKFGNRIQFRLFAEFLAACRRGRGGSIDRR